MGKNTFVKKIKFMYNKFEAIRSTCMCNNNPINKSYMFSFDLCISC